VPPDALAKLAVVVLLAGSLLGALLFERLLRGLLLTLLRFLRTLHRALRIRMTPSTLPIGRDVASKNGPVELRSRTKRYLGEHAHHKQHRTYAGDRSQQRDGELGGATRKHQLEERLLVAEAAEERSERTVAAAEELL